MREQSSTPRGSSVASPDPSAIAPHSPLLMLEPHSRLGQAVARGLASKEPLVAGSGPADAESVGPPRSVHQQESRDADGLPSSPQSLLGRRGEQGATRFRSGRKKLCRPPPSVGGPHLCRQAIPLLLCREEVAGMEDEGRVL